MTKSFPGITETGWIGFQHNMKPTFIVNTRMNVNWSHIGHIWYHLRKKNIFYKTTDQPTQNVCWEHIEWRKLRWKATTSIFFETYIFLTSRLIWCKASLFTASASTTKKFRHVDFSHKTCMSQKHQMCWHLTIWMIRIIPCVT